MARSFGFRVTVLLGILAGPVPARALVVLVPQPPGLTLPIGFQGRIPTEDSPLTGEDRLAKMRREGRLPDRFTRNGCAYLLAGDPAVAYYVEQCPRR